jgi:hypothetical protein
MYIYYTPLHICLLSANMTCHDGHSPKEFEFQLNTCAYPDFTGSVLF